MKQVDFQGEFAPRMPAIRPNRQAGFSIIIRLPDRNQNFYRVYPTISSKSIRIVVLAVWYGVNRHIQQKQFRSNYRRIRKEAEINSNDITFQSHFGLFNKT